MLDPARHAALLVLLLVGSCGEPPCESCFEPECATHEECDGPCEIGFCNESFCEVTSVEPGTPCRLDLGRGPGVCDASSICVACLDDSDCPVRLACSSSLECVASTCVDGAVSGDESDVDCGGSCGGCPLGQACRDDEDCAAHARCGAGTCELGD